MPVSDDFLGYVKDQLSGWGRITSRRMFGGVGLYRDGLMFGLLADDIAYLKVDDSNREAFVKAGSGPLTPDPQKGVSLSYYEVPPEVLESPDDLVEWARRSLAIQKKR